MDGRLGSNLERCVACGQRIGVSSEGYPDHRCSPRFESIMDAVQRREQESRVVAPTWAQRLAYGMGLLHEAGD